MQIEIIDVSQPTSHGSGDKVYQQLEVAYKKDGKVEGKKMVSFKYPEVFKAVQKYSKGDIVDVTSVKEAAKDGKEYWQWTNIEKSVVTVGNANIVHVQDSVGDSIKRQCAAKIAGFLLANKSWDAPTFYGIADEVLSYINNKHKKPGDFSDFEDDIPQ